LRKYGGAPETHRLERRNPCCSTRHFAGVRTPDFQPSTCPLSSTGGDLQLPEIQAEISLRQRGRRRDFIDFYFFISDDFKREFEVNNWDQKCLLIE
jgi:hypothetical protein